MLAFSYQQLLLFRLSLVHVGNQTSTFSVGTSYFTFFLKGLKDFYYH